MKATTKKVTAKKVTIKEVVKPKIVEKIVTVNVAPTINSSEVLSSIVHPNKKILAERIINGEDFASLLRDYGRTRVMEMQKYINTYEANQAVRNELKAKRGGYGVCIACQK